MEEIVGVESKVWAMLSYLGPFCLWSAMKSKEDEFVRFHAKQGIVLFIIELVVWSLSAIPLIGAFFVIIGKLFLGLAMVFGIIGALSGEEQSLPIIGLLAEKLVL